MLDSNGNAVISELITGDISIVAITTPNAMVALKNPVAYYTIPAECDLYAIGWCIGKIILEQEIIITTTLPLSIVLCPAHRKKPSPLCVAEFL